MTTKHQPATPLPFAADWAEAPYQAIVTARGGHDVVADTCMLNGINFTDSRANAAYIAHAANAYPRLVAEVTELRAVLRELLADRTRADSTTRKADERNERSAALLRELGEG